jgi:hypothetical protein
LLRLRVRIDLQITHIGRKKEVHYYII